MNSRDQIIVLNKALKEVQEDVGSSLPLSFNFSVRNEAGKFTHTVKAKVLLEASYVGDNTLSNAILTHNYEEVKSIMKSAYQYMSDKINKELSSLAAKKVREKKKEKVEETKEEDGISTT
jgi:predicted nucleotide-binding protein (sugar kinase/HSP70/actin superfamily)